ncbi:MAG: phosphotransferase, partial [Alphaproteobacteria bacterium]
YMPLATGTATPPATRAHFQQLWMELWPLIQTMPQGLIMFDYHAANLLLLGTEPKLSNLGLIDIQDARVAPVVQDMAILLRDDRRGRDEALEQTLLNYAAQQFNIAPATLRTGFNIASLHHCSRILGGASRLLLRDNRTRMAAAIARRWDIAEQSADCPELQNLLTFMRPYKQAGIAAAEQKAQAA